MSKQTAAPKTSKPARAARPSCLARAHSPNLTPAVVWQEGHAPHPGRQPGSALSLTVTIPAKAVPMLRACAELYETSLEDLARLAVVGFIKSETILTKMDEVLAGIPD